MGCNKKRGIEGEEKRREEMRQDGLGKEGKKREGVAGQ